MLSAMVTAGPIETVVFKSLEIQVAMTSLYVPFLQRSVQLKSARGKPTFSASYPQLFHVSQNFNAHSPQKRMWTQLLKQLRASDGSQSWSATLVSATTYHLLLILLHPVGILNSCGKHWKTGQCVAWVPLVLP